MAWRARGPGGTLGAMQDAWNEEQARWIFRRAATLARAGAEPVGAFVLPDGRFFPDTFDRSPASVKKLMARLLEHLGLDEIEADVALVEPEEGQLASSCSSGGCGTSAVTTLAGGRLAESDGRYTVAVAPQEM